MYTLLGRKFETTFCTQIKFIYSITSPLLCVFLMYTSEYFYARFNKYVKIKPNNHSLSLPAKLSWVTHRITHSVHISSISSFMIPQTEYQYTFFEQGRHCQTRDWRVTHLKISPWQPAFRNNQDTRNSCSSYALCYHHFVSKKIMRWPASLIGHGRSLLWSCTKLRRGRWAPFNIRIMCNTDERPHSHPRELRQPPPFPSTPPQVLKSFL
jgi:hypothetical protein